MTQTRIYASSLGDGFAWVDTHAVLPDLMGDIGNSLTDCRIPEYWSEWQLTWLRTYGKLIPDIYNVSTFIACSAVAANKLWPIQPNDLKLLPVQIESQSWFLVLPQITSFDFDAASSRINRVSLGGVRRVVDVPWVNIVYSKAANIDLLRFKVDDRSFIYFTESLVKRIEALNLRGLNFQHVGYIVDSPERALPEPPRPVVAAPGAARWPRWREAADELVQASEEAGFAWMRRQDLPADSPAADVLPVLTQAIESARVPGTRFGPKAHKALLAEVGGAWGQLVHRDCAWQWVELPVSSRTWRLGLASPQGSHALCLDQVIERQLASNSPSTLKLMYNMIRAGNLPPGEPGDHVVIG